MKILMVTAEYAPLAKAGGLADAVAGLTGALHRRGHDVRVLLPRYSRLAPRGWSFAPVREGGGRFHEARAGDGPRVYLLDAPPFADSGEIYTGDEREAARFLELDRGALELPDALGWRPDLVHCHDWHTALVPALLRAPGLRPASLDGVRSMLTLHNVGYQGVFPEQVLAREGGPALLKLVSDEDRADGTVVFLRTGIRHADVVTTVSPTYAREILTPEYGMGLETVLRERAADADFVGLLNGVDYGVWSPEIDPFINHHYDRAEPGGKQRVKRDLCQELGLDEPAPVIGLVARLVAQKGVDLLVGALPALLERTRARFALLGNGDSELEHKLAALAAKRPSRVAFRQGYDEALSHRIIAGADLLLVPSRYEPCGLTQMYALRYGTIPVVRATGGLADTIVHFDPATGTGNGSVFEHADAEGLIWGVTTALAWLDDPALRRRLMNNAMQADFSWDRQAQPYERLYRRLCW